MGRGATTCYRPSKVLPGGSVPRTREANASLRSGAHPGVFPSAGNLSGPPSPPAPTFTGSLSGDPSHPMNRSSVQAMHGGGYASARVPLVRFLLPAARPQRLRAPEIKPRPGNRRQLGSGEAPGAPPRALGRQPWPVFTTPTRGDPHGPVRLATTPTDRPPPRAATGPPVARPPRGCLHAPDQPPWPRLPSPANGPDRTGRDTC